MYLNAIVLLYWKIINNDIIDEVILIATRITQAIEYFARHIKTIGTDIDPGADHMPRNAVAPVPNRDRHALARSIGESNKTVRLGAIAVQIGFFRSRC